MSEWFYYPVTEWGKEIAEKLTQDNGIRIDVHEVLRKLEPTWINTQEKAFQHERLNKIFSSDDEWFWKHLMDASEKLEAIRGIITREPIYQYLPVNMEETIRDIIEVMDVE